MKRILLGFLFVLYTTISSAKDPLVGLKMIDMLKDGVYVRFGLGLPQLDYLGAGRVFQGLQPSFELGSQHMFVKKSNKALGANFSWFTIATSLLERDDVSGWDLNLGLVRFGPMFSAKLADECAMDLFFNFSPTAKINLFTYELESYNYLYYGVLYVPGFQFRFKRFIAGAEANFGSLFVDTMAKDKVPVLNKVSYYNPRIFIGVKY